MVTFKPSDVDLLGSFPPLAGTMGKSEAELAAAIMVLASREADEWRALTLPDLGAALGEALDAGVEPFASLNRNPFARPDVRELVARGFAAWSDEPKAITFTDQGLEALRRYVRPRGAPP